MAIIAEPLASSPECTIGARRIDVFGAGRPTVNGQARPILIARVERAAALSARRSPRHARDSRSPMWLASASAATQRIAAQPSEGPSRCRVMQRPRAFRPAVTVRRQTGDIRVFPHDVRDRQACDARAQTKGRGINRAVKRSEDGGRCRCREAAARSSSARCGILTDGAAMPGRFTNAARDYVSVPCNVGVRSREAVRARDRSDERLFHGCRHETRVRVCTRPARFDVPLLETHMKTRSLPGCGCPDVHAGRPHPCFRQDPRHQGQPARVDRSPAEGRQWPWPARRHL